MSWLKTNNETTEETTGVEDAGLLSLVRTMDDDLAGRETPSKMVPKSEPLVGFDPNTATGAPFYAAPGVDTAEPIATTPETSPFFQSAEPVELVDTSKTNASEVTPKVSVAAPPATLPVLPVESVAAIPGKRAEEEVRPVALNVIPAANNASFEGMLPEKGKIFGKLQSLFLNEKTKWFFLGGVGIALLLIGGGLYFWQMSKEKSHITNEITNKPLEPSQKKEPEPVVQGKYQADHPNVLSFDTETVTPLEIKNALLQAGQGIKQEGLTKAVEFLVRDQKLNPLALSRFAYLAKIELPASLLEVLDESFSLFIVIDNDRPRVALLAYTKNQETFSLELQKNEKALPLAIEPLFLDTTTAPKTNLVFRDSTYLERPVRFANIDATMGLSVDYAVRGKQWVIGTSKNSLRAVLDKTGL